MQRNDIIKSVLSRCVIEPEFLFLMINDPKYGMYDYVDNPLLYPELLQFDYNKLLLFSSFVSKVKNNNTWKNFHQTRMALKVAELENNFFKSYFRSFIIFKRSTSSKTKLQQNFYLNLKKFLSEKDTNISNQILSVLDHEWTILQLKNNKCLPFTNHTPHEISCQWVPDLNPCVAIQRTSFNPITIIQTFQEIGHFKPMNPSNSWLLYKIQDGKLNLTIQNEIVGLSLSLVDGKRSIENIGQSIEYKFNYLFSEDELRSFFTELYHKNILK